MQDFGVGLTLKIYHNLIFKKDYNLTQWGWIELDYSYRLIVDVMTPSCGKGGAMLGVWGMGGGAVLFNKRLLAL